MEYVSFRRLLPIFLLPILAPEGMSGYASTISLSNGMAVSRKRKAAEAWSGDFTEPFESPDAVVFVVEQRRLYASRSLLEKHSEYFVRMFSDEWKPSSGEIQLPDKKYDDVLALLRLIKRNPEDKSILSDSNLEIILAMADEYDLKHVSGECVEYIFAYWRHSSGRALRAVYLAEKYGFERLKLAFLRMAAYRSFSEISAYKPPMLSPGLYAVLLHLHVENICKALPEKQSVGATATTTLYNCRTCNKPKFGLKDVCTCCTFSLYYELPDDLAAILQKPTKKSLFEY